MRQSLPKSARQTAIHKKRLNLFGWRSKRNANSLILPRDVAPPNRVRSENGKHPTDDAATQDSPLACPIHFQQAYPSSSHARQAEQDGDKPELQSNRGFRIVEFVFRKESLRYGKAIILAIFAPIPSSSQQSRWSEHRPKNPVYEEDWRVVGVMANYVNNGPSPA